MSEKDCYIERGFKIKDSDFRKTFCKCEVCTLAKIKKFISHVNSERYSYWPGEFYYVDFSGPFETSMQGNIYMVLFVDRATRLIVGIFVKNEDTAVGVIRKFRYEFVGAKVQWKGLYIRAIRQRGNEL